MKIADYKKARARKIEELSDLDGQVVRRIVNYLRDNHTLKQTADRFDVPIGIVRDIAFEIGR